MKKITWRRDTKTVIVSAPDDWTVDQARNYAKSLVREEYGEITDTAVPEIEEGIPIPPNEHIPAVVVWG